MRKPFVLLAIWLILMIPFATAAFQNYTEPIFVWIYLDAEIMPLGDHTYAHAYVQNPSGITGRYTVKITMNDEVLLDSQIVVPPYEMDEYKLRLAPTSCGIYKVTITGITFDPKYATKNDAYLEVTQ